MVRLATLKDLDRLEWFQQALIDFERPFDDEIPRRGPVHSHYPKKMIHSRYATLLVAEIDGELVGCAAAEIRKNPKYCVHKQWGYIDFVYVLPQFREQGVAHALIDSLIQWLNQKSISYITLEVYADNVNAVAAYKKMGFSDFVLELQYKQKNNPKNDERLG